MMNTETKKKTGSFYTCNTIADYIAKWAIDTPNAIVLEPSFGDGIFIESALSRFSELGNQSPKIVGVEIQEGPYNLFIRNHPEIDGHVMDFMDYHPRKKINVVIGNPPYVSLKNLKAVDREKALQVASSYGIKMQTSGSLWMPFIIHATGMLAKSGKLGFVLPYEITHVRYAFNLWKHLSENYGKITICRVFHDFFPDVDVETIVLLAEQKGSKTNTVDYKVFETIADLYQDNAYIESCISIDNIFSLSKPFERELIPNETADFLDNLRNNGKLTGFVKDCKFRIGYVSGNKRFFHLSADDLQRLKIRATNAKKCLINAKQISSNKSIGLETNAITEHSYLFYPTNLYSGEKQYISFGESHGVNQGYKCRVRKPWYLTPGLEIPDIVLTVFGDVPKMLLNNGNFYVSNSLLGGFSKNKIAKELICRWYNSLTLLSVETTIHSLGGGTLVLIPGETDRLEIISDFPSDLVDSIYNKLSAFATTHTTADIYEFGDNIVLKEIYGFSEEDIKSIKKSLQILRTWRNPEKRRG